MRKGHKWLASGYCVLDNDFAEAQYGAPPMHSLRVTAAHEFFHAVQFAYDYGEDPWLMEATATWMEERVADDVNDNRQYLPYGQVGAPGRAARPVQPAGLQPVRQLDVLRVPQQPLRRRGRPADLEPAGAFSGVGPPVLHGRGEERAGQARRLHRRLPPLRGRQHRARRAPTPRASPGRSPRPTGPGPSDQGRTAGTSAHDPDRPHGLAQRAVRPGDGHRAASAGSCGSRSTGRAARPRRRRTSS